MTDQPLRAFETVIVYRPTHLCGVEIEIVLEEEGDCQPGESQHALHQVDQRYGRHLSSGDG